jgi:BirA family biotin operon repressor/biotin-[acetyl-CoA-carboxylase] ligase
LPERCSLPDLPYSILHFLEIDSTSQYLREWGRQFPENGLVVWADYQTAGRGRMGRVWHAERTEGLCFSMLISPAHPRSVMRIPLAAAVVLYDTLVQQEASLKDSLDLKWPNDVLLGHKKVAGILTELDNGENGSFVVLGVGLNCNQEQFSPSLPGATSLRIELGRAVKRATLLEQFLRNWHQYFQSFFDWPAAGVEVIADWKTRSQFWRNQPVQFVIDSKKMQARTRDLAPSGALVVLLESGEQREIISGEVEWIRVKDGQ